MPREEPGPIVVGAPQNPQQIYLDLWEVITNLETLMRTNLKLGNTDPELVARFVSAVVVLWHRLKFKVPEKLKKKFMEYEQYYKNQDKLENEPTKLFEIIDMEGEVMESLKMFEFEEPDK